ncbi:hypothetical protein [Streptomyces lydicus]|uniref:hypothetical protein n=1 Tax=Streptomyces lydicus TaxID=47763 RepID=UPI0037940A28
MTRLLNPSWSSRHVQAVHGPADLTRTEAAQILSPVLERLITAERITDEAMYAQLTASGMPPRLADAVLGMSTGLRADFTPEQPRTPITTTPTTLMSWAYETLTLALT